MADEGAMGRACNRVIAAGICRPGPSARAVLTLVGMWKPLLVLAMMAGVAGADVKVTVKSSIDDSRSTSTATERKKHEDLVRLTIDRMVARGPIALPGNRNVDARIVSLTTELVDDLVVVTSEIRVAVSDDSGRITAVLSGGAKAEMAVRAYRSRHLPQLREDALVASLESMYVRVKDRLHGKPAVVAARP
jgi:hypothetical protein